MFQMSEERIMPIHMGPHGLSPAWAIECLRLTLVPYLPKKYPMIRYLNRLKYDTSVNNFIGNSAPAYPTRHEANRIII